MLVTSKDGVEIHYEETGEGDTALVFIHGWMGNTRWWDAQRDAFAPSYRVVTLDLAGHGQSGRTRTTWSAQAYANDIVAVTEVVGAQRIILVAHSMAGGYATLAAPAIERLAALILVDTLKTIETMPVLAQVEPMLAMYRADFAGAIATVLPKFLYAPTTPPAVIERLAREFLTATGEYAATLLAPLYSFDAKAAARAVRVPVRGIGTDLNAGNVVGNRAYFADYDYVELAGFGHYPMLECPDAFNAALRAQLAAL